MRFRYLTYWLITFLSLNSYSVHAHDIEIKNDDGEIIYYTLIWYWGYEEMCVSYKGKNWDSFENEYVGNVVIPEFVSYNNKTYRVRIILEDAFRGCSSLTSITIPNSVIEIRRSAFEGCSSLTSITIPNSVTTIGDSAFEGCSSLTYITIPNSVKKIESDAFYGCISLTSITIPNSVTAIRHNAFYGCSNLASITIPNSVTTIGDFAFEGCSSLTSITIPNSVIEIRHDAFWNCSNLASISVETGNTKYDSRNNCNGIIETESNNLIIGCKNTTIPNSVTTIGESAFCGCSGLTSITIPNSVTTIGEYAFYDCSGLTSITISNSVMEIRDRAFERCSSLTSITIPNSVTTIGKSAFQNCSNLVSATIGNNVWELGSLAFCECSSLTSITIPNSVKVIESGLFWKCSSLTSVTIGDSVTYINRRAFSELSSLKDFYCYTENVPGVYENAFRKSSKSATLHVPATSISSYKSAYKQPEGWGLFKKIIAIGETDKYNLTYVIDEEVFKIYTLEEGATITPEAEPTKEGYTFSGWSEIPSTMPAHDVTVTGYFSINKYKLTYKVDGEVYKQYDIEYGASIAPEQEPIKEGYIFSGWSEIPKTMPAHDVTISSSFAKDKKSEIIAIIDNLINRLEDKSYEIRKCNGEIVSNRTIVKSHIQYIDGACKTMDHDLSMKSYELEKLKESINADNNISQDDIDIQWVNEHILLAEELITFLKTNIVSSTFTCNEGGKITVGDVVVANDTKQVYWLYTDGWKKGFGYGELSPFKIIIVPEEGYYISSIEIDGKATTETSFDSDLVNGKTFVAKFVKNEVLIKQLEEIEKMRKTISKTRQFMKDVKAEIANGKNYEVNSAKGIEEAFYDMNIILDEVEKQLSSYENRIKEGDKISEEDFSILKGKCDEIADFESYFKEYEHKVVLSCNEGGSLAIGMSSVRNETKTIYWLYGKAFTVLYILTGRTGYSSIYGDVEVTPDEGYKIANVTKNGEEVTNLINLYGEGEIVAVFEKIKPVEVKANDYTREYGDPNPEFEFTLSEGSLTGMPEITCEATETSEVGDYSIIISSGTIQNDNVIFVNGTLSIIKAPLKVTAKSFTIKQGDEMPSFEALYSGFKNNETSTVLIEQPKFNCNATSLSAPGTYNIEVSGASATNYEVSYENGTLTITPGTFKITYMVDGEIYKEYEIEYGATITPEAEPIKEGYTFSGWSWIPSKMPAEDVTITGTFKQIDFKIDNVIYEISGGGTVTIKGGDQIISGSVEISGTVVINGQTYNVTAIAENAFKDNTQITSVTIAEGISTIGENAFRGCVGLMIINIGKDVTSIGNKAFANVGTSSSARTRGENAFIVNCYAESVPQAAIDAFENSPIATGTLLVNDNIVDVYKTTSPWSGFGKIQGFLEAAGINAISFYDPNARIYDINGKMLENTKKGVNIIKMRDGKVKKIVVK